MQSIIRFVIVMAMVFGTVLLWRSDHTRSFASPPKTSGKGQDPQEEIERSLRPLRMAPVQQDWSKEAFQARVEDAIRRNDPCAMLILLREATPVSPEAKWALGNEVVLRNSGDVPPSVTELFAREDSPLLGKPNEESKHLDTRFFNALLYSGQLEGGEADAHSFRNNEKAIAIFRELAQEDAENGAYNFFLAQALKQSGAKKEEAESAYILSAKAPRFDTFYQGLYDNLLKLTYNNLAAFTWVYSYLHNAPMPNFANGTRNLRNWASDSDTGKWIANRTSKRLIDVGAKYKTDSPGYLYSQVEYMLGYGLRYTLDGKWEKDREEYMEKMKEARDNISEIPPGVSEAVSDLYRNFFQGESEDCRWSSWQALFQAYRAKR